ncbi:MAG: alpha-amylase family glycosyl hydrolase [Alistipes onderdonkii]
MNDVAQQKVRVTALRDYIYADRNRYPQSAMRLVFTSNHDENSWNGSEFTRMGGAREIMAAFTFVVPRGLPLVYTGQEIGYDHSFAFFDRDPIPPTRPIRSRISTAAWPGSGMPTLRSPPGRRAARWSRYATTPRIA